MPTVFHKALSICLLCLAITGTACAQDGAPQTGTFKAADELTVTADLYIAHEDKKTPLIILFHQAGWSRGEYRETAPKLNKMGFNCIAVDQRSGEQVNRVTNQTAAAAKKARRETDFVAAYKDMEAALAYAHANHAEGPVIVLGSSYSAGLVFKLASEHPDKIDGVLAFSPGEYFARLGQPENWIATAAAKVKCPVFITAARNEAPRWKGIYDAIKHDNKTGYTPSTKGQHGSRALWEKFDDNDGYWAAMKPFLKSLKTE